MNKYIFTLLTVLAGIGTLALYKPFGEGLYSPFKPSKIDAAVVLLALNGYQKARFDKGRLFDQVYQEQLAIHDAALRAIKKGFQVPDDEWNSYMNAVRDTIACDDLMGPSKNSIDPRQPSIIQHTQKILGQYGINADRVCIKQVTGEQSKAEAIQDIQEETGKVLHTIEINVEWFNKSPLAMQEAFIRHEIMHLLNYDCIEEGYIVYLLESLGYENDYCVHHPAMIHYRQAREIRADLLAACHASPIAQALHDHYAHYEKKFKQYNNNPEQWLSHPPFTTRKHELASLLQTMDNTKIVMT